MINHVEMLPTSVQTKTAAEREPKKPGGVGQTFKASCIWRASREGPIRAARTIDVITLTVVFLKLINVRNRLITR